MDRKVINEAISVIIPVFNASATLFKCLDALEKQTFRPGEVIVVDDGSTDGTFAILSELRIKNLKVKIFKQKHKGVSEARNLGARKACGGILVFIDSDCVPTQHWLEKITVPFSDPYVGAVGGGYSSGVDKSFWQNFSNEELFFRRRNRSVTVNTLLSNNMACRRDLFWQAGGFPKRYPVCEDMLLSYKLSRISKICWLKNNGVKHHFKSSLKDYLLHQYFFGKQSTFFFMENPMVLASGNHQGRKLHLAISTSSLNILFVFVAFILFFTGNFFWGKLAVTLGGVFLLLHLLLYKGFIFHLQNKGISNLNLIRAYFVSYSRDLLAVFSFFAGLALYIRMRKL